MIRPKIMEPYRHVLFATVVFTGCKQPSQPAPKVSQTQIDAACIHEDHPSHACDLEPQAMSSEQSHFGAPFELVMPSTLSKAIDSRQDTSSEPIQVIGQVSRVCQKKGCWLTLKHEQTSARVLMKGHFSVPKDSKGKQAVVEGKLSSRTFTLAQSKHLAQDGGQDPDTVTEPKTEYVLKATGVAFTEPSS